MAVVYLNEHEDARETARPVGDEGRRRLLVAGDIGDEAFCREAVSAGGLLSTSPSATCRPPKRISHKRGGGLRPGGGDER